jgi:hypothetical protein
VTDAMVDDLARRVLERLSRGSSEHINAVVRRVMSEVAERLVREEIDRMQQPAIGRWPSAVAVGSGRQSIAPLLPLTATANCPLPTTYRLPPTAYYTSTQCPTRSTPAIQSRCLRSPRSRVSRRSGTPAGRRRRSTVSIGAARGEVRHRHTAAHGERIAARRTRRTRTPT